LKYSWWNEIGIEMRQIVGYVAFPGFSTGEGNKRCVKEGKSFSGSVFAHLLLLFLLCRIKLLQKLPYIKLGRIFFHKTHKIKGNNCSKGAM
jgi:hypothetical protein